ncbi:tetratricopeptide repeat protein [Flaviaesturariibacter amylovorans]|uniref:Tetratricopeptide repeat protein n=1 Tax=Flaviaesturariibacter amylovorans TaxID=1084520 RepID=A0ABP8HRS1_9BACT
MRFLLLLLLPMAAIAQYREFGGTPATARQDSIMTVHLKGGAWKYSYLTPEWTQHIDAGLRADSTIAYLWQQKAMPLFKMRKHDLAMEYLDKAVQYDAHWLDYRAFMKCIFAKQYRSALQDFAAARAAKGNASVMDHTYDLWSAVCHLQLNESDSALRLLQAQIKEHDAKGWTHHLDLYYLGIAYYETGRYPEALAAFDRAIAKYSQFSDAYFYKGKCLGQLGRNEEGLRVIRQGKVFYEKGYSINEDNSIYETYPYQVAWRWKSVK